MNWLRINWNWETNMADGQKEVIELRSEEVQELMGQVPTWILRWGITIVGFLLVGLMIGSCLFKYPETLSAELTITTLTPPVEMYARATGKLQEVKGNNKQEVLSGDILAVVESAADYEDVFYLDKMISLWKQAKILNQDLFYNLQNKHLALGELQPAFTAFINALHNNIHYHEAEYYPQKINMKTRQIKQRGKLKTDKYKEIALHQMQNKIATTIFQRDSILFTQKLISEEAYNYAEQTYLQSKQSIINDVSVISQFEIERLQDSELMLDLYQQYWSEKSQVVLGLSSTTEQLENALRQYEQTYVIKTPISGTVNMMGSWKRNQTVNSGDLMMIIIPNGSSIVVGRAKLPAPGAGKVKVGQKVKARITNFPDAEYGYVKGIVKSVSSIPDKDSYYYLEISFPDGLKTNYGKVLPQTKKMVGVAEIIVKDKRLIENFIDPIMRMIKQ